MKYNTAPGFVGIEELKRIHSEQISEFEKWAAADDWERFHYSHYDWWTFPLDKPSSFRFKFVVYDGEVSELKNDAAFMTRYRRGLVLVSASWGWDVRANAYFVSPRPGQSWHHWPVRLYKAAYSARQFGEDECFRSLKAYGQLLIKKGNTMNFAGHDLSGIFES